MRTLFLIVSLVLAWGCSSQDVITSPLANQILRPRPGYEGLTHKTCLKKGPFGNCKAYEVIGYPITKEFIDELISLKFVCKDLSKLYQPCYQKSFGVCHVYNKGWGPFKKKIVEFTDFKSNHQKFINSQLECFSLEKFSVGDFY